uniref:hypothetical protein n=1 Tax=Aetokthonos hydrillicola TaxID=1550245 RepID=UPI001ABAB8EE
LLYRFLVESLLVENDILVKEEVSNVGWVEGRNPTFIVICWVSLTLYPTYDCLLRLGHSILYQFSHK